MAFKSAHDWCTGLCRPKSKDSHPRLRQYPKATHCHKAKHIPLQDVFLCAGAPDTPPDSTETSLCLAMDRSPGQQHLLAVHDTLMVQHFQVGVYLQSPLDESAHADALISDVTAEADVGHLQMC